MSKKVSTTLSDANPLIVGLGSVFGIGLASLLLIRAGYEMGVKQSKKMVRGCNREYRRMEKLEKKILKEQRRQKKEREKSYPNVTRLFFA